MGWTKKEVSAFCIRLPLDLSAEIRKRASDNERTLNQEITQLLRAQVTLTRKKKDNIPDSAI